ncbi:hypothetical protein AAG570_001639 [Ranatra chinensis]|uniref:Uncharacterized protein n=1 Tax=Ranatra chinensis TaxID=642074 RepID=A0ABD0YXE3_9HEMI
MNYDQNSPTEDGETGLDLELRLRQKIVIDWLQSAEGPSVLLFNTFSNWLEELRSGGGWKMETVTGIIGAAMLMALTFVFSDCAMTEDMQSSMQTKFYVLFQNVYKRQKAEWLNTMSVGVQSVMREVAERPCVLLMMAPRGCHGTAVRLAIRLAECALLALGQRAPLPPLDDPPDGGFRVRGSRYSSSQDYWHLYGRLVDLLQLYKMALVTEFQSLHPQVTSIICHLADDTHSPQPQSIILLVLDIEDRFSEAEINSRTADVLADIFLDEILGPFLDREVVAEVKRHVTGRAILVARDQELEETS